MRFFVFLFFSFLCFSIVRAEMYECSSNGAVYSSQSLCSSTCSGICSSLVPSSTRSSGSCDYNNFQSFVFYKGKTYAVSKQKGFWSEFINLVIITNAELNSLLSKILTSLGVSSAWIGLYDPNKSSSYNFVNVDRFMWVDGSNVVYSNFVSGEPDNYLFDEDIGFVSIPGEHWIKMNSDGTWEDDGYHKAYGGDYKPKHYALVEWNGPLDCVNATIENKTEDTQNSLQTEICNGQSPCYVCYTNNGFQMCDSGITTFDYNGNTINLNQYEGQINISASGGIDYCFDNANQTNGCLKEGIEAIKSWIVFIGNDGKYYWLGNPNNAPLCKGNLQLNTLQYQDNGNSLTITIPQGVRFIELSDVESLSGQCIGDNKYNLTITIQPAYLCPQNRVQCDATFEDPLCPEGRLNPNRDVCETDANIQCPTGYTWDSSIDKCTKQDICLENGTLNKQKDRCEKVFTPTCPTGYTADLTNRVCYKQVDCGIGTFNSSLDRCEYPVAKNCPVGYVLNGNICEKTPSCPTGTTYSTTLNKCITDYKLSCPAGYTYNRQTNRCETNNIICPDGYSYNASTNRCEDIDRIPAGKKITVSLGRVGDNYWSGYCSEYFLSTTFTINDLSKVQYLKLVRAKFDDWIRVKLNGNIVYVGPYNLKDIYSCRGWTSSWVEDNSNCTGRSSGWGYCELGTSWNISLNIDLKPYLKQGTNTVEIKVIVSGKGEGYIYIEGIVADFQCSGNYCSVSGNQYVCPTGYIYNNGYCEKNLYANPSCPNGGILDGNKDICYANAIETCPTGTILNNNLNQCIANPICSYGALNTLVDKCQIAFIPSCPSGWSYDNNLQICYQSVRCDFLYNASRNRCEATLGYDCGSYTYSQSEDICIKAISCPVDNNFSLKNTIKYDTHLDVCLSEAIHKCPSGETYQYTWNSTPINKCELIPICINGQYNSQNDRCYLGDFTCPLGSQYQCVTMEDGKNYCSDLFCGDSQYANNFENLDTPQGLNDKKNDGTINEEGECEGTIYIFNGQDRRCRKSGIQTAFNNCCTDDKIEILNFISLGKCNSSEVVLVGLRNSEDGLSQCHYVGEYCAEKWKLIGACVQKKKTYCCFGSILARIIQEQGREQLGITWGTPTSPNCRGFTPEEFQNIDFGKIDFSEFRETVKRKAMENLNVNDLNSNFKAHVEDIFNSSDK